MSDPRYTRRRVLKGMAAAGLMPLLGANLYGCMNDSSSDSSPLPLSTQANFSHGVASGDPLQEAVIIWTRAMSDDGEDVTLEWQVSTDASFANIAQRGKVTTRAEVDYTVKVDVTGLLPGSTYFYRFVTETTSSVVGKTKTLPSGRLDQAALAVVSCSNFPAGFFHVYRQIANTELDAVIHLGDYIYEYGADGYATEDAISLNRVPTPATEIVQLADYRQRYAQYRSDSDLQDCHAAHAFIAVWDDHEITNDTWREGAENHQAETEGSFSERKVAALQAYYEWMPIRPPADLEELYRSFKFGDLLDLIMLDTRLVGRDEQLAWQSFLNGDQIDVDAAMAAIQEPVRTLLGEKQKTWLKQQLTESSSRWQMLGQQVLMGRYHLPSPIIESLALADVDDDAITAGVVAVSQALEAKSTPVELRTSEQQALLDSALPYNLDAWDGYAAERDELIEFAHQMQAKLVVLAGDTHNAWCSQLTTASGDIVGVELATASVSSPGLEGLLGDSGASFFEVAMTSLVDDLKYTNLRHRGYLLLDCQVDNIVGQWQYVTSIKEASYSVDSSLEQQLTVVRDTMQLV